MFYKAKRFNEWNNIGAPLNNLYIIQVRSVLNMRISRDSIKYFLLELKLSCLLEPIQ